MFSSRLRVVVAAVQFQNVVASKISAAFHRGLLERSTSFDRHLMDKMECSRSVGVVQR